MTVIAVASAKGRGVTTAAELFVRLRTTGRRCVLIDADPAGGDWLLRPGVAPEPGLVSLAMAGRRRLENGELFNHVQVVGPVELVVGPAAAHQAATALEMLGPRLVAHVRGLTDGRADGWAGPVDAVVDCGRLTPGSPAMPLALEADLVVLVSPATAVALVHLAPLVEHVAKAGVPAAVLLHGGEGRSSLYGEAEVAAGVGVEVLGTMADDAAAAARLAEEAGHVEARGRSRLARSMTVVADRAWELAQRAEQAGVLPPPPPVPAPVANSYAPVGWRERPHG
jgi:MinD-like ATPase involved in chromosome partitioning or flagellar assembly